MSFRRTRKGGFLALLAALAMVLAACPADDVDDDVDTTPDDDTEEPADPGEAADRGELVLAVSSEPPTLSPARVGHNEVNTVGMKNVYEALVDRDPETGELIPLLATSWEELDEDHWRFELREGVNFHDGSPFNADAAVQALEWLWDPETPESVAGIYGGPEMTFEAVDEYTLDVFTEAPDPIVPTRMYFFHFYSVESAGDTPQESFAEDAVGTGPYRFVEWNRGQNIVLEPNDDWWGLDDPDGNGEINFESVTFEFRPESTVRTSMIEAGEAHLAMTIAPDECERLEGTDGVTCATEPAPSTIFIQFDAYHDESILSDQRIREAVALSVDMDLIIETLMEGGPVRAAQIVGPSVDGHVEDLEPYGYDPDEARALIEEFEADGGQLEPITYAFQEDRFPRVREVVQAIGGMMEDVGFEVEILEMETAVFLEDFNPGNHPPNRIKLHSHGNTLGDFGPSLANYFGRPEAPGEPGCWCDDEELFQMAEDAISLAGDERISAFEEVNRHIHEQVYMDYGGHLANHYGLVDELDWGPPPEHFFLVKHMSLR